MRREPIDLTVELGPPPKPAAAAQPQAVRPYIVFTITRRDWWLAIAALAAALVIQAIWPRYEWHASRPDGVYVVFDRWAGRAYRLPYSTAPWWQIDWSTVLVVGIGGATVYAARRPLIRLVKKAWAS
jgi:hypothetical protein